MQKKKKKKSGWGVTRAKFKGLAKNFLGATEKKKKKKKKKSW